MPVPLMSAIQVQYRILFFFFNDTATTEIYTLSLHDALPIYYLVFSAGHFITYDGNHCERLHGHNYRVAVEVEAPLDGNSYAFDFIALRDRTREITDELDHRSEEHTSELQSPDHLVCRLLLEK